MGESRRENGKQEKGRRGEVRRGEGKKSMQIFSSRSCLQGPTLSNVHSYKVSLLGTIVSTLVYDIIHKFTALRTITF